MYETDIADLVQKLNEKDEEIDGNKALQDETAKKIEETEEKWK